MSLIVTPVSGLREDSGHLALLGLDVTERRLLERRLNSAHKFEAIGQLAAAGAARRVTQRRREVVSSARAGPAPHAA